MVKVKFRRCIRCLNDGKEGERLAIVAHDVVMLMQEMPSHSLAIGEGEDRTLCYTLTNVGALPGTLIL